MEGQPNLDMRIRQSRQELPLAGIILSLFGQKLFSKGVHKPVELARFAWPMVVGADAGHPAAVHYELLGEFAKSMRQPAPQWRGLSYQEIQFANQTTTPATRISKDFYSAVNRVLDHLAKQGVIAFVPSPRDKRNAVVRTKAALPALEEFLKAAREKK